MKDLFRNISTLLSNKLAKITFVNTCGAAIRAVQERIYILTKSFVVFSCPLASLLISYTNLRRLLYAFHNHVFTVANRYL